MSGYVIQVNKRIRGVLICFYFLFSIFIFYHCYGLRGRRGLPLQIRGRF